MSASEAARQKLDGLRRQQCSYREKLHQQEAELRRLQNEVHQNRTVVEVTMPGEINKAYGEYLEILKKSPQQPPSQKESHEAALAIEQDFAPGYYYPHRSFFSFSCTTTTASPGSLLSLLTFTTTILSALWDALLGTLAEHLLAHVFAVLGFFFPAVAHHAATKNTQRQQRLWASGRRSAAGDLGSPCEYGRRGSTRFAPIHM